MGTMDYFLLIVGGSVGGGVLVLIIIIIIVASCWCLWCRRQGKCCYSGRRGEHKVRSSSDTSSSSDPKILTTSWQELSASS